MIRCRRTIATANDRPASVSTTGAYGRCSARPIVTSLRTPSLTEEGDAPRRSASALEVTGSPPAPSACTAMR